MLLIKSKIVNKKGNRDLKSRITGRNKNCYRIYTKYKKKMIDIIVSKGFII